MNLGPNDVVPRGRRVTGARSRRRLGEHINIPRLKRSFHLVLPCGRPLRDRLCVFYNKLLAIDNQWNVGSAFASSDVRRRGSDPRHGAPSTRIRSITNRRSLLSTSFTRRAVASPRGSVSASCGARRGYSVSLSYPFIERLRQFLSPDGRTGVSSRPSSVSNGPHPFWAKRFLSA